MRSVAREPAAGDSAHACDDLVGFEILVDDALDGNGNAVFGWRRIDVTKWRIQARTRAGG